MKVVRLGDLEAVMTPEMPDEEVRLTVVLLHGYGAPGTDLVGLANQIPATTGTRFVFPAAPLSLEPGLGPHGGRAWWPIDMVQLQVAMMTKQYDGISRKHPQGLDEARSALHGMLEALCAQHGASAERLVIGGFSQGAMLALDWALRTTWLLRGLIQLSGTVICDEDWRPLMDKRTGLPVLQSHSPDDMVLPYALAERLAEWFQDAGWDHEFISFRGGHGIGPGVTQRLEGFIRALAEPVAPTA